MQKIELRGLEQIDRPIEKLEQPPYYKPGITAGTMRTPGKPVCSDSEKKIEKLAVQTAEKVVQQLRDHLEGE